MTTHRYRTTVVTTKDYGSGGKTVTAHIAAIPDGQHWQSRPAVIELKDDDAKPGDEWAVSFAKDNRP